VAKPLGLKSPKHHISLRLLKWLLSIPPVAWFLNTKPEALDFIQTNRFNTAAVERFANRHGIVKPDIRQALQHTATFVNAYYIAKGQAL
jgi:hypothetical protein